MKKIDLSQKTQQKKLADLKGKIQFADGYDYKAMRRASPLMSTFTIKHNELTAEQFRYLWESVWGEPPTLEQTALAMKNTLFRVSIFDGEKIVAMARAIGDKGLCYYIKDVVVHPDWQKKGLGKILIQEILKYIDANGTPGTQIFVELCAMPDKIPFYQKFGFEANEAQRLRIMYKVDGTKSC